MEKPTYEIGGQSEPIRWILCLVCGYKSWNVHDIEQKYCGHCCQFHEFMKAPKGPYQDTHSSGKKPQEDPQGPKND